MIRRFCDICDTQIQEHTAPVKKITHYLAPGKKLELSIHAIASTGNSGTAVDVCRQCVVNIISKALCGGKNGHV